ncbi:fungal-specific transcription factor domain-containing protein [Calycina marina]|uniref:Fungal-specific transcription factor domain-containing protein n=1 Tax=Calycina marina TaxID=1763456 RepID=A0A9P8CHC6_9HELO|nr:fungal-specific transcription factor domain-containing protein [Calycina marina]
MSSPIPGAANPTHSQESTTPSKGPGVVTTKEFACVFPGCTKAFTRAEHLHRHALNHNEGNGSACYRCSAVFKRRDLLERHMARHKEKDDEAGGEGLGKLLTRKRLWRNSAGEIVSKKRPEHEKERKPTNPRSAPSSAAAPRAVRSDTLSSQSPQSDLPMSPRSIETKPDPNGAEFTDPFLLARESSGQAQMLLAPMTDPRNMQGEDPSVKELETDSFQFLCNGSWGSVIQVGDINTETAQQVQLDSAATSTFPTMANYAWLFGNDPWPSGRSNGSNNGFHKHSINSTARDNLHSSQDSPMLNSPEQRRYPDTRLPPISRDRFSPVPGSGPVSTPSAHGVPAFAEFLAMSQSSTCLRETSARTSTEPSLPVRGLVAPPVRSHSVHTPPDSRSGPGYSGRTTSTRSRRLPIIGELARNAILGLVDIARPRAVDGRIISRHDPLLSNATLQHFSDLFFRRFNSTYPLLHQPTFDPVTADPLLLFAILQLGASYSTKDDHIFAVCLHNTMRSQIMSHTSFSLRPCLWILQTILLVDCFGKSRAGQLQYDMSQLFHTLLTNLIRKSEYFSARNPRYDDSHDLTYRWHSEIEIEQCRRLAFVAFTMSTQNALLFAQPLSISPTELQITLPWDTLTWEADNAESWVSLISTHRPQSFLPATKAFLNASSPKPPLLNGLSRNIILHGIIAFALDLERRELMLLGPIAIHGQHWKLLVAQAYDAWKSDFDTATKITIASIPEHQVFDFQKSSTAVAAFYHIASIALNIPLVSLQIFADAQHVLGRNIDAGERARALRHVDRWAAPGSMDGATSVSQAALLLRDGITKLHNWDAGDALHYHWCVYLATLTCWAFFTTVSESSKRSGNAAGGGRPHSDNSDWDARAEMNALISATTLATPEDLWRIRGKYHVSDLPRVMAKALGGIRWAVVQEGVIVLRHLSV